jgi:phosphoglycolate phosphatase
MPLPDHSYDFWLFDLDGTLVDVEWSYVRATFDRVGDRLGHRFTDERVESLWHGLEGSRNAQLRELGVDPPEFWETLHDVEDPQVRAEATYLHDDAAALLSSLETPVGVVTHCAPFLTRGVLDHLDLRDRFDAVVCCSDDVGWKPDPSPVRHAMAELGVDTNHRGVLAGDMPGDVGAAWNAGLDGVHVERHGSARRGRCVLGDYRVTSLATFRPTTAAGE